MNAVGTTIQCLDWVRSGEQLDADGYALLPHLIGADAARELGKCMQMAEDAKRAQLHAVDSCGAGWLYFGTSLPAPLAALRVAV